jgi:hypothetical protein
MVTATPLTGMVMGTPAYGYGYGTGYYGGYRYAYHPVIRRHIYCLSSRQASLALLRADRSIVFV